MYDKKFISVTSHALLPHPSPCHKLSHLLGPPPLLERDVLYGRPLMRSDGLEKRMMLAHGDGRRRGRPRRKWMDEIHEVTGMKLAELRDVTISYGRKKTLEKDGQDNR